MIKKPIKDCVVPMLNAYQDYFISIINLLLQRDVLGATQKRIVVDNVFKKLPDWFYNNRLDIAIQIGRRYFLLKLERLGEILFSMHHLARHSFDEILVEKIREPVLQCAEKTKQFFGAFVTVLELAELKEGIDDFSEEIARFENQFRTAVPYSTELLDVSKDYVYLAEFIFELKELRRVLLKIAEALR